MSSVGWTIVRYYESNSYAASSMLCTEVRDLENRLKSKSCLQIARKRGMLWGRGRWGMKANICISLCFLFASFVLLCCYCKQTSTLYTCDTWDLQQKNTLFTQRGVSENVKCSLSFVGKQLIDMVRTENLSRMNFEIPFVTRFTLTSIGVWLRTF